MARYQFLESTSEKLGSVFSALGGERVVKEALGSPLLRTKNDAEVTASDLKEAFSAVGVGMFMDEASAGNERLKTHARWLSEEHPAGWEHPAGPGV